jgi:engulfment and cell motility protein 2
VCPAGRAFCELLRDSEVAFEEVYCASFALLDRVWLARGASYMEFNAVMAEVKGHLDRALRRRPKSLAELREHLTSSL